MTVSMVRPVMNSAKARQPAKRASVSTAASAVIRRGALLGDSKLATSLPSLTVGASARSCSRLGQRLGQLMARDQSSPAEPPTRPPMIRPKVAQAMPQGGGSRETVLVFSTRAPGSGRTVTAHQRDGAPRPGRSGFQSPARTPGTHAHDVLHDDEDSNHAQEEEQRRAAPHAASRSSHSGRWTRRTPA